MVAGARPKLNLSETQAQEELITDYPDFFAKRAVTTGAQTKGTTGSSPAIPGPSASLHESFISESNPERMTCLKTWRAKE